MNKNTKLGAFDLYFKYDEQLAIEDKTIMKNMVSYLNDEQKQVLSTKSYGNMKIANACWNGGLDYMMAYRIAETR